MCSPPADFLLYCLPLEQGTTDEWAKKPQPRWEETSGKPSSWSLYPFLTGCMEQVAWCGDKVFTMEKQLHDVLLPRSSIFKDMQKHPTFGVQPPRCLSPWAFLELVWSLRVGFWIQSCDCHKYPLDSILWDKNAALKWKLWLLQLDQERMEQTKVILQLQKGMGCRARNPVRAGNSSQAASVYLR